PFGNSEEPPEVPQPNKSRNVPVPRQLPDGLFWVRRQLQVHARHPPTNWPPERVGPLRCHDVAQNRRLGLGTMYFEPPVLPVWGACALQFRLRPSSCPRECLTPAINSRLKDISFAPAPVSRAQQ